MSTVTNLFQLLIVGRVGAEAERNELQVIAQFNGSNVVEELTVTMGESIDISSSVGDIRGFVESGTPVLREQAFRDLGGKLFRLVFRGKVKTHFDRSIGATQGRLPCQFICADPVLASWPWEYVYDDESGRFLCLESNPVLRGLTGLTDIVPSPMPPRRVRLLLALGVPPEDPGITPLEEIENITTAFESYLANGAVSLRVVELKTAASIDEALNAGGCDIFHYFGHAGFKLDTKKGYLSIQRPGFPAFEVDADLLGQTLAHRGIKLVFLNACKSARGATNVDPARSAVAAGLLARGIPVVMGTQFKMPDRGSHFFSCFFYNALATGSSVVDSVHAARRTMSSAKEAQFYDWGIPALYAVDPRIEVFPAHGAGTEWGAVTKAVLSEQSGQGLLARQTLREAPSLLVHRTVSERQRHEAKFKVTIVDLDANVGFLPKLLQAANAAQTYYSFQEALLPVPSGYQRTDATRHCNVQTYLPWLTAYLRGKKRELDCDYMCVLTKNMISTKVLVVNLWNFFAAPIGWSLRDPISCVSTFGLRDYAGEAGTSFAKASFCLCLAMVLYGDPRWHFWPHRKTHGCFFDLCWHRPDIVVGLTNMRFGHERCRNRITDAEQLEAIDALLALDL